MLNEDFALRDKGVSDARGLDSLARHRWYFVKEGFSPKLIDEAIERDGINTNDVLFDPFSGSGTAPLTGALKGLKVRGIEINPFLRFLSATKLNHVDHNSFKQALDKVLKSTNLPIPSHLEGYSTFTEPNRWDRWLFPIDVLRRFEAGRRALYRVSPECRSLLKLALLAAVMDCCNAERDGKCLRYPSNWKQRQATPENFQARLVERSDAIWSDLEEAPLNRINARITEGDAKELLKCRSKEKFRLCITSPPYLNSFDYSDIYRPELFLGGFVRSNKSLMKIRLRTVRSHLQARWPNPTRTDFGSLYSESVSLLHERMDELWDPRMALST